VASDHSPVARGPGHAPPLELYYALVTSEASYSENLPDQSCLVVVLGSVDGEAIHEWPFPFDGPSGQLQW
jgi:hypothetical protein